MPDDPEPLVKGLRISPTVYATLAVIAKKNRDSIAETADRLLMEIIQKSYADALAYVQKSGDEKPRKK